MTSDYSKSGIRSKQRDLHNKSPKFVKKLLLAILNLSLIGAIGLGVIGASMVFGLFKGVMDTSPNIDNLDVTPKGYKSVVYDLEGNKIAELISQDSNRSAASWDMIPDYMKNAFVAIEDERFYEHNGIDIKGIIRAAYVGVSNGFHFSEGASTITQQLLKNNVFTSWTSEHTFLDSLKRKIQEQYLAVELSKTMSKEDILLNYMNSINLGSNTLGVQAASNRYFNRSISTLSLSECAVIAGITQNPAKYNPILHPDANAERRKKVLRNMLEQGYISESEYQEAMADDPYSRIQTANEVVEVSQINSYFVDALTEDVLADLLAAGYSDQQAYTLLYSGGLKIYSTQDPKVQRVCDDVFLNEDNYPGNCRWMLSGALTVKKANGEFENHSAEMLRRWTRENLNKQFDLIYESQEDLIAGKEAYISSILEEGDEVYDDKFRMTPQPQVCITVETQNNGYIVAMVGGRGKKEASRTLNRATSSKRQPGSTFKIVAAYAPAFDIGATTLATAINDAPFNYTNGIPVTNWYTGYRGLSNSREGIKESMNILAVKTITLIGAQTAYDYLKKFGFTTVIDREERTIGGEVKIYSDIQQALALGGLTYGVTCEELNSAYACIANGGRYIKPRLYTKVVDHDGNIILDNEVIESTQVLKESTSWLLTSAMRDVATVGTGASVNFNPGMGIAGKTGTTSDYNDVWFAGYTPYYTASVWEGYDNNTKLRTGDERNLAKKLWKAVMSQIHDDKPNEGFPMPAGIVSASVCKESGKLPIEGLCNAHIKTEYFAEGTVPTETCDVHYSGDVCQLDGKPACETCPFKAPGIIEVLPDNMLMSGDAEAGNVAAQLKKEDTGDVNDVYSRCQHNQEFMLQPGVEGIIEQQRLELQVRGIQINVEQPDPMEQYQAALEEQQNAEGEGNGEGEANPEAERNPDE